MTKRIRRFIKHNQASTKLLPKQNDIDKILKIIQHKVLKCYTGILNDPVPQDYTRDIPDI